MSKDRLARRVSACSSRYTRTLRAWAKLSFNSVAVVPICSCMPPDARRTRRPMRWIGTAASGYSRAAIRLSSQSMTNMPTTSPTTVTASPSEFTARIIASRMVMASVVKRAASWAGASRSIRATSALTRWPNICRCRSRITTSTRSCTATVWPYCAAALAAVIITTRAGTWYRMRGSWAANMSSARRITSG